MDKLEEELPPHAKGVDIALAAFGVGKGSAKRADEEVRKIEITYPEMLGRLSDVTGDSLCVDVRGDTRAVLRSRTCEVATLGRDRDPARAIGWIAGLALAGLAAA